MEPRNSASLSTRVRDTWLGQLYFTRLKKYRLIKWLAPRVWNSAYFLYRITWIYGKALKRPIIPLSSHAERFGRVILSNSEIVTTPHPNVFPESSRNSLSPPHAEYIFPEIYITEVCNALVTGGTNLVMTENLVICHDLYDFPRDFTPEEQNWRAYIWPHRHRIAWLMPTTPIRELERAACFTDGCAHNYAHWMTEVLPRIKLFCGANRSPEIAIIVNDGLHNNIMRSLRSVVGEKREIVSLPMGSCVRVERLSVTSVAGYVPFERRSNFIQGHSHGRFSPFALLTLRQSLQDSQSKSSIRKVYIKRNSEIRNITNAKEIEDLLFAYGFTIVEPEKLSHEEQVALFTNADLLVGATGAAMANIIFCKPSTKIVILISDYKFMPYWYWQNMACSVGNRVTYVLGKCTYPDAHLHSDFYVKALDVLDAIDEQKKH